MRARVCLVVQSQWLPKKRVLGIVFQILLHSFGHTTQITETAGSKALTLVEEKVYLMSREIGNAGGVSR